MESEQRNMESEQKEELLLSVIDYIKQCRKYLHQIPELANEEFKTQAFIINELTKMGIAYETHDTAVIGILKANAAYADSPVCEKVHDVSRDDNHKNTCGKNSDIVTACEAQMRKVAEKAAVTGAERTCTSTEQDSTPFAIAFRSDMDALPVCEQSGNAFPSTHEGRMHACGHDGHMSMLLGTAKLLSSSNLKRHCDFVFVFQPAEESVGGALPLIKTGFIERLGVKEIFGIHLHPNVAEGRLATASGPFMARGTDFNITVRGVSAHAAMPHLGIDALLAASHFITNVQQIVSRNTDPTDTAVFTVGSMQAGERRNIIAKEAYMEGIFRTFSEEQGYYVERRMREIASAIEIAHGVTFEFWVDHKYPAVINDARLAEEFFVLNDNADRIKPQMISEDFSFYQQEIPGLFFYVGTRNEERGLIHPLHSAQFDFVPDVLINGPRAYLNLLFGRGYIEV